MADFLPNLCEYSKSARAKCKKCKEPIPKDVLRMARIIKSPFHDGTMPAWYHYECFFEKFSPQGTEEITGFEHMRFEDQKRIEASIEAAKSAPSTSAGRKGKGGKATKRKADNDLAGEFSVQYAKSGKSLCKLCEGVIANKELRIGKKDHETAEAVRFGPIFRWYHVGCFVTAREELQFFGDADQLPEFKDLEAADKRTLKKQLKACADTSKAAKVEKKEEEAMEVDPAAEKKAKKEAAKEEAMLKKQSDEMFGYIEKLKPLRRGELLRLFEANDIDFIPDDSNKKLEVLADAMAFGRPVGCPVCGGYLRYKLSHYECRGNINEWEKCSYETETPERTPFIIPEHMKESYNFLKSYKPKTGVRVHSSKMKHNAEERRKQQLAQLIDLKAEGGGDDETSALKPLNGLLVAVLGKQPDITGKITELGGKVAGARSVGKSAAFLVTTTKTFHTSKSKVVNECQELKVPVVSDAVFDHLLTMGLAKAMMQSEIELWDLTEEKLQERLNNLNVKSKIKETFAGNGKDIFSLFGYCFY